MLYIGIFIIGIALGAGPEKNNEFFNKGLSKASEVTKTATSKAIELKDKVKK
jgi:hypothetical protein